MPLIGRPANGPGGSVQSRRWSLWVNHVAASPLVHPAERMRILRRLGLSVDPGAYSIGSRCHFHSANIEIAAEVLINDGCYFENVERVTLERGVALAPRVTIVTSTHLPGGPERRAGRWTLHPVVIEEGCWIGVGAVIQPGVRVGRGSIVAAGAVVTRDLEPNGLYAGVPARLVRRLDETPRLRPTR